MRKSLLALLVLGAAASPTLADLSYYDPFNYVGDGSSLSGQTNLSFSPNQQWFRAGSGANDPKTAAGNLAYPGLADSTGNSVTLTNTGTGLTLSRVDIQPHVGPATGEPAVSLYYSMVMRVTDLTGLSTTPAGSFISGLQYHYPEAVNPANDGMTSTTANGAAVLAIHTDGVGYTLGVGHRDTGPSNALTRFYDTNSYTTSDTLFVVVKYVIGAGNKDDAAYLYVNPSSSTFGGSEPASYSAASFSADLPTGFDYFYNNTSGARLVDSGGVTVNSIRSFFLRNNGSSPRGVLLDELRVGTTWADVTPRTVIVEPPVDLNHDGVVDLGDINYITARWLNTGPTPLDGDANGDGVVDLGDINYVTARWLNTGAPAGLSVVPEPASLGLLGIGAVGLLSRRRRA